MRRTFKGLNGREDTKPYNTRANITNWIIRKSTTRKETTKHDGSYSRASRSDTLGNNPDSEPGTDETNYQITKWRNKEAQGQGTRGLPRSTTQTTMMASPTHSILEDSRVAEQPS